ncbi:MAG: alpha/beta hydrolase [Clostridiales bacterium]|nr:alpha/beta hydrolase [Clostridiales bacterium]
MKIAVVFPGIGYHVDKPLLYYSKKIAAAHGYEIKDVPYGNFPSGVKGNKEKMDACFTGALDQCEDILRDVDFSHYTDILFLSKSIGTAIASAYGQKHGLKTRNAYFTPVGESFQYMDQPGIVFHGTADGWVDTEIVITECKARNLPLHIIENANHSLEVGDWAQDIRILKSIMTSVEKYVVMEGEPACFS